MATKDGRSQIWYADGNGNVAGYTESVDYIADTIISTYNKHFGTDIQIWTPETKTLQVGGTVPDWSAYEKIEMSQAKYYGIIYDSDNKSCYIGYKENGIFYYAVKPAAYGNPKVPIINYETGICLGEIPWSQSVEDSISQTAMIVIGNVNEVTKYNTSLNNGDVVENWENYTIVNAV